MAENNTYNVNGKKIALLLSFYLFLKLQIKSNLFQKYNTQ